MPTTRFPRGERYYKDGLAWRAIDTVTDLFSRRSLSALSVFLGGIELEEDKLIRTKLMFIFSASLWNATKMYQYRPGAGGPQKGTYYLPPIFGEPSVKTIVEGKMAFVIKAQSHIPQHTGLISTQSSTHLSNIPDSSIDYVFTDPPYAGQVQYGELNFVWEAWLNLPTDWHGLEIIENKTRGKTLEDWKGLMVRAFSEVNRVLKPGRWCTVTYHDTDPKTWELLHEVMWAAGFVPDDADRVVAIDTEQKSYNQMNSDKNAQTDLVVNFYKPRFPGDRPPSSSGRDLFLAEASTEGRVMAVVREHLRQHPGQTRAQLYDAVISRLVRSGQIESFEFERTLERHAGEVWPVDGRYYLPGQAIPLEDGGLYDWEGVPDSRPEAKIVAFVSSLLRERPRGYGEILAEFNTRKNLTAARAQFNASMRGLEALLEEGFAYDEGARTYRIPSKAEREDLEAMLETRRRRAFRRWLEAARTGGRPETVGPDVLLWALGELYRQEDWSELLEAAGLAERLYGPLPDEVEDYATIARSKGP